METLIKLNNERLANKNIKSFENGEPLISYILNTLKKLTEIDKICVYCSNDKIQDYLPQGVKYLKRSENLDLNTTKINEVLKAFADDVYADIYVLAHATAPFVQDCSIKKGLDALESGEFDSAFAVKKIQEFLWEKGEPLNYDLSNIPRTQDLEKIYVETSGFYIYKRELIKEENRRIGHKPYLVEVSKIESIDIDEEEDFIIANAIFNSNLIIEEKR